MKKRAKKAPRSTVAPITVDELRDVVGGTGTETPEGPATPGIGTSPG